MDIAERLEELTARGAYGELCAEARAYLARSTEEQDEDTAYMVRVRHCSHCRQRPSTPKAMRRACAF